MSQQNVELVREGYARWRAGDYDVLLDFLLANAAPDIELFSRFGGFSGDPTEDAMECAPGSPRFSRASCVSSRGSRTCAK